jgi:hypothetical protein
MAAYRQQNHLSALFQRVSFSRRYICPGRLSSLSNMRHFTRTRTCFDLPLHQNSDGTLYTFTNRLLSSRSSSLHTPGKGGGYTFLLRHSYVANTPTRRFYADADLAYAPGKPFVPYGGYNSPCHHAPAKSQRRKGDKGGIRFY